MEISDVNRFDYNLIRNLYQNHNFVDKFTDSSDGIDVIVPLLHSNDLWRENLKSFYREIPIRRLLVGDAGAIDDSIKILSEFPRVTIYNHKNIKTLGKSLALLIDEVSSNLFIYLHSDVYLPKGWFDEMVKHTKEYDWYGSSMQTVVAIDYPTNYSESRPYIGAQMGKKEAFNGISNYLEDDYVYRSEEFVLDQYIRNRGFKSGGVESTFIFHQMLRRKTTTIDLGVEEIQLIRKETTNKNHDEYVVKTQAFSIIKYCRPTDPIVINAAVGALNNLSYSGYFKKNQVIKFCNDNGPEWIPYVKKAFSIRSYCRKFLGKFFRRIYLKYRSE
jgi:hypothetical protein